MKISFYAPFKPLGHPNPSGDLVIATGLYRYLERMGFHIRPVSSLRSRWIYWKPWLWPLVLKELKRGLRRVNKNRADIWLTYHTYYKAPDILGPWICYRNKVPYVIFQGVYSTKRKKKIKTFPGFALNKMALSCARHVFTNKQVDLYNLKRILPQNRITYVPPGIYPEDFGFDADARSELRKNWQAQKEPVILSTAMFRPGVKTQSLTYVIRACGELHRRGRRLQLVIAGAGKEKSRLQRLADERLFGHVRFVGEISRSKMYRFYSAGDIFVFPGIEESLGMVFLEAQSCGLPVIAFENGGVPEVVKQGETGLLVPLYSLDAFIQAIERLLDNRDLRLEMGLAAKSYVRSNHDLNQNYRKVGEILKDIIHGRYPPN